MERKICFVCGNKINLTGIYKDNAIGVGNDLYRHKHKCAPLTERYKEFERNRSLMICNNTVGVDNV